MTRSHNKFIADEDIIAVTGWNFAAVDQASIRFAEKPKAQADAELVIQESAEQTRVDAIRQTGYIKGYEDGFAEGHAQATLESQRQMADYISHGDVVFFNTASTAPESGMIFLLRHPDGLRIKRLRRDIDGTWLLEYVSQDKRRFPDEHIPHERIATLEIVGKFIYRQGG